MGISSGRNIPLKSFSTASQHFIIKKDTSIPPELESLRLKIIRNGDKGLMNLNEHTEKYLFRIVWLVIYPVVVFSYIYYSHAHVRFWMTPVKRKVILPSSHISISFWLKIFAVSKPKATKEHTIIKYTIASSDTHRCAQFSAFYRLYKCSIKNLFSRINSALLPTSWVFLLFSKKNV